MPAVTVAEAMRDPLGLNERLFAAYYPRLIERSEGTLLGRLRDLVEVPHRYVAAGCYPNRRTERLLADSPLAVQSLAHGRQPRSLPMVRPMIIGTAIRG
jgi:hypothetical protein